MFKKVSLLAAALSLSVAAWAGPKVEMQTSAGRIVIELDDAKAPVSSKNFLAYVQDSFYNGTIFHRVISGFMIQGGGFDTGFKQKPTKPPIPIESKNGLKNDLGWVAMARTNDPNSATAQFFINISNNDFLNYPGQDGNGYTVFAKVVSGLDVVQKIGKSPTGPGGPFPSDVPRQPIVIESMTAVGQK